MSAEPLREQHLGLWRGLFLYFVWQVLRRRPLFLGVASSNCLLSANQMLWRFGGAIAMVACAACGPSRPTDHPTREQRARGGSVGELPPPRLLDEIQQGIDSVRLRVVDCADKLRQSADVPWNGHKLDLVASLTLTSRDGVGKVESFECDWPPFVPPAIRTCIASAFLDATFTTEKDDFTEMVSFPFCIGAPSVSVSDEVSPN